MSIKITCKMCSRELEVPDAFAGKKGKCPHCFEVLDIPTAAQAAAQQLAGTRAPAAAAEQPSDAPATPEPQPASAAGQSPAAAQPQPIPKPAEPRRVRLAVVIPAAAVVVAVAVCALVIIPRMKPRASGPDRVTVVPQIKPDVPAERPQTGPDAGQQPATPAPAPDKVNPAAAAKVGIDRFPETQKIAAGLPAKTALYLEILQPKQFVSSLASQPVWKDKATATQRCDAAYEAICQLMANEFGVREMDVQQVARRARAIHLAFAEPGDEPPVVIAVLDDQASREKLLGEESTAKPANTLEFAGILIEEYRGELDKQVFVGYHGTYAVIGSRHDLVQDVLKRLRNQTPGSLASDPAFVQALATRPGEGTWVYFAPKNDDALAGRKLLGGLVSLGDIHFVQAVLDPQANVLSGSMAAEGLLAAVLSGPPGDGALAAFAPGDCPVYAEFSSRKLEQVWNQLFKTLFPEQEQPIQAIFAAAGLDPAKDFLAALGPHFAVMMPKPVEKLGLDSLMVAAEVPDTKRLQGSIDKLNVLTKLTGSSHQGYNVYAPDGGDAVYALGGKTLLVGGGKAGLTSAIDAAAAPANLGASPLLADARRNGAAAVLLANAAALLQARNSTLADALAPDASTCLAAHEKDGAIRISGDLNLLGIACAYLSDAAEKRKITQQREQKAGDLTANEQCRQNIIDIYEAINRFIVKDLEESLNLQYPKTLNEVIDAGLLKDISILVCPLDQEPGMLPNGIQCSYDFVFNLANFRLPAEFSMQSLVVWEHKPLHDGKHLAIRVDGHSESLTPDKLQKELDKSREEATSKKPRQVNIPENPER